MVALLRYIYGLPYGELLTDGDTLLRSYAVIYIVADKYQVKGLKLAVSNSMKREISSWDIFGNHNLESFTRDSLEALSIVINGTTFSDQLARKVMVEGCVMNMRHLQQQPALISLLRSSADLGAEIIGHKNLECGLPGAWVCGQE